MSSLIDALHKAYTSVDAVHGVAYLLRLIVVAFVVYALIGRAVRMGIAAARRRIPEESQQQRVTTLLVLVGNVARYVFIFFVVVWVLKFVGLDIAPVIASAGVLGLAVGFGAQNLVRDVVSGFFIMLEGQYGIGDLVEINTVFGRVEEVGLRITKLRDPNGELRYFPNGGITTVNRYTAGCVAYRAHVPVPGDAATVQERVQQALADFDAEFTVFARPPECEPVAELATYARLLPVSLHVIPGRQALVTEKLPARLTAALNRAGTPLPEGTEVTLVLAFPPPGGRA
jgi:small-conductance mechanosensitive channel